MVSWVEFRDAISIFLLFVPQFKLHKGAIGVLNGQVHKCYRLALLTEGSHLYSPAQVLVCGQSSTQTAIRAPFSFLTSSVALGLVA